jgi:hypothetical protein
VRPRFASSTSTRPRVGRTACATRGGACKGNAESGGDRRDRLALRLPCRMRADSSGRAHNKRSLSTPQKQ